MSEAYYYLTCVDCAEALQVGKIATMISSLEKCEMQSTPGEPVEVPPFFTGFLDRKTRCRVEGAALLKLIERFLILHRTHQLHLLSLPYIDQYDLDDALHDHFDSEFLNNLPLPENDPWEDAARTDPKLAEKVKQRREKR